MVLPAIAHLLVAEVGPLEGEARRQRLARQRARSPRWPAPELTSWRIAAADDVGGGIAVVAHDRSGPNVCLTCTTHAERHHLAGGVARPQLRDVLGAIAERRVGLRDHLVGAAEAVEVVDVRRAQIDLHRLEQLGQRRCPAPWPSSRSIVGVELRHVGLVARERPASSRRLRDARPAAPASPPPARRRRGRRDPRLQLEAAHGAEAHAPAAA